MNPRRPGVLFMQKHWDVMRSDDAGDSWREVSGNLPTDFGFAIDVHAHEPETIFVAPIKSDSEHYPLDGKLQVWRSKTGGNEWEAMTNGLAAAELLRERAARCDGRRFAGQLRGVFRHDGRPGVCVAGCGRQLEADRARSAGGAVGGGADAVMIRVELPHHLRVLAQVSGEVTVEVAEPVTLRRVLDALEARYPVLRGTIRDHDTKKRRPFLRFFACQEDLSHDSPDDPLPEAVAAGKEPLLVIGAIAGGCWPHGRTRLAAPMANNSKLEGVVVQEIKPFLWFDDQAEEAMQFYVSVFKNAKAGVVTRYPEGGPGKPGSAMIVTFTIGDMEFIAMNGGPGHPFTDAISLMVPCETQAEIDEMWAKLSAGGGRNSMWMAEGPVWTGRGR